MPTTDDILRHLLSEYMYVFVFMFLTIMFKNTIENLISGFGFFLNKTFNEDDIVYIKRRRARITKIGVFTTIFYMFDSKSRWHVANGRLRSMDLEKVVINADCYKPKLEEDE